MSPLNRPEAADLAAQPVFQPWLLDKEPGDNLGIVRRDFVNNQYARQCNKHIIRMNKFSDEPNKPPVDAPINYFNTDVHLYAPDGRHVFVDVKYAPEVSLVTAALAEKIPWDDDVIFVQNYYPTDATPLYYRGNITAPGTKTHGPSDSCTTTHELGLTMSRIGSYLASALRMGSVASCTGVCGRKTRIISRHSSSSIQIIWITQAQSMMVIRC
jgi:hypothetical protein